MREIIFYRTASGHRPVEQFLDSLTARQGAKATWTLRLIEELEFVPQQYFKKLVGTDDIWEVRVNIGRDMFRLLSFFDSPKLVVLNHAFAKKTQKIPRSDIRLAEQRKRDYFRRKKSMSDLKKYVEKRKARDPEFAENYEAGYLEFKIGVLLRQAREEAGLTQEEVAQKLNTKKSAISRIENHAKDIRLSTLGKYAKAVGKKLHFSVG